MKSLNITEFDLTSDLRQRRFRKKLIFVSMFMAVGISLFGCSAGSGDSSANGDPALAGKNMIVRMSDAPPRYDWIARTDVVVSRLDAQITTAQGTNMVVLSSQPETINLLDLRGGLSKLMGALDLPPSTIDQVRLVIDSATVTLKDGSTYPLKVPSGQQSGLKIFIDPPLEVVTGRVSELMLDFDVSRSFVLTGNPQTMADVKGFIFKPVVRVGNSSIHGSLNGIVYGDGCTPNDPSDDQPLSNVTVDVVDRNSLTVVSNSTASSGRYAIYGLAEGAYTLNFSREGYSSGSIGGVSIYAGNNTTVDRITLAQTSCNVSAPGTSTGTGSGTATDTSTGTAVNSGTNTSTGTSTATTTTSNTVTATASSTATSTAVSTSGGTSTSQITTWQVVGFDGTTTYNSATLIWQTQVPTTALIKMGTRLDAMQVVASVINPDTAQIVTIDGLIPSTAYYLQVVATDSLGISHESEVIVKTTKIAP